MEPRVSLSVYAFLIVCAVSLIALRDLEYLGLGVSVGVALFAALLDGTYLTRTRKRRAYVLWFRRKLDRIVRAQWFALAVAGSAVSVTLHAAGAHPLDHAATWVDAVSIGALIATATLYVSAVVDWYWILPTISGMTRNPPCMRSGAKAFHGVTKVWYFHRAAATTMFTFVLAAVPAYIAGTISNSGSERAALTLFATALAIGFNAAVSGTAGTFKQFLSPSVVIGDIIRVRESVENPEPKDALVVDVSIQGLKYAILKPEDEAYDADPEFSEGVLMPIDEVPRAIRSQRKHKPCESVEKCKAVNWYCLRNPNANQEFEPNDQTPADLTAVKAPPQTGSAP
jgi:hypothetical protein